MIRNIEITVQRCAASTLIARPIFGVLQFRDFGIISSASVPLRAIAASAPASGLSSPADPRRTAAHDYRIQFRRFSPSQRASTQNNNTIIYNFAGFISLKRQKALEI